MPSDTCRVGLASRDVPECHGGLQRQLDTIERKLGQLIVKVVDEMQMAPHRHTSSASSADHLKRWDEGTPKMVETREEPQAGAIGCSGAAVAAAAAIIMAEPADARNPRVVRSHGRTSMGWPNSPAEMKEAWASVVAVLPAGATASNKERHSMDYASLARDRLTTYLMDSERDRTEYIVSACGLGYLVALVDRWRSVVGRASRCRTLVASHNITQQLHSEDRADAQGKNKLEEALFYLCGFLEHM